MSPSRSQEERDMPIVPQSRILAIDPGETTGISFIENGIFVWGMVAEEDSFYKEKFIWGLATMTNPTTIVLEIPPAQTVHPNLAQRRIYDTLERFYKTAGYNVVSMNPGQWKGLTERTKVDSTHIKDAADMGKVQYSREIKTWTAK